MIEYFKNIIMKECEYYLFLLNKTEELGFSTKMSIINLFFNLPKKLNESLYYFIEEDVLYNINLFFRENKNLFLNIFIEYYINDNNKYDLYIYKIQNYMNEIKLDKDFNKTISKISENLINNIINNSIKSIREFANIKINSLYELICNVINNNINLIINNITINPIPEEMLSINELIYNYSLLIESQNNRYHFIVGKEPFNLLNDFIEIELQPPLLLIKESYNNIENKLLSEIKIIADNFPDCYSIVKEKINVSRIKIVDEYLNNIFLELKEYENTLKEDIQEYVNKLVHFTYINGLDSYNQPCKESYCLIQKDNANEDNSKNRRLNKRENKNNNNIKFSFDNYSIINRTKIKNNINKNVNFKRKLTEYTSSMGSLSEYDLYKYLIQLEDSIVDFNKTYLGKEFNNINISVIKFLTKINTTYLEKLKRSFSMKIVKFSTILTENSLKNLEKVICKQYYQIESYIHEISYLIKIQMNNFINELNNTSFYLKFINDSMHNKVKGYYEMLYNTIQSKYELILEKNKKSLGDTKDIPHNSKVDFLTKYESTKDTFSSYLYDFENKFKNFYDKAENWASGNKNSTVFLSLIANIGKGIYNIYDIAKKKIEHECNPELGQWAIPFPPFPFLQIRIIPGLYLGTYLDMIFPLQDTHLGLDINARAEVSLSFEAGIYIPPQGNVGMEISISTGLKGILGSGRAGIKLYLRLRKMQIRTDIYWEFNAMTLYFYVKFRIKIDYKLIKFNFEYNIIDKLIIGYHKEYHKESKYDFKSYYISDMGELPYSITESNENRLKLN